MCECVWEKEINTLRACVCVCIWERVCKSLNMHWSFGGWKRSSWRDVFDVFEDMLQSKHGLLLLLYSKQTVVSVFMHLAVFTAKDKHATWLRGHFICDQRRRKIWSNRGKVTDLCSCPHRKHRCCHCCHQLDQKERCVLVLHRPKKGLHPPASGLTGALVESTRSHTAGPAGLLLEMN